MRSMYAAGPPQKKDMTGTPAASAISSLSVGSHSSTRFTPNGRSVSACVRSSNSRNSSSSRQVILNMPSPPALLTAATSSGVDAPPIGAWTIGISIPSRFVSRVLNHITLPPHIRTEESPVALPDQCIVQRERGQQHFGGRSRPRGPDSDRAEQDQRDLQQEPDPPGHNDNRPATAAVVLGAEYAPDCRRDEEKDRPAQCPSDSAIAKLPAPDCERREEHELEQETHHELRRRHPGYGR